MFPGHRTCLPRIHKRHFILPSPNFWAKSKDINNDHDIITYSESKDLKFSKQQLYDIVSDVERYVDFVPFCTYSQVITNHNTEMDVDLGIGFKGISERYRSRVLLKPEAVIAIGQSDIFDRLVTEWKFKSKNEHVTKVDFSISFKFNNPMYKVMAQGAFGPVSEMMIQAFRKRCEEIYGKR